MSDRPRGFWRLVRRVRRHKAATAGFLTLVVIVTACAGVSLFIGEQGSLKMDLLGARQAPSWGHWFGTDELGRDLFVRCLYGGRISLLVGVLATLISLAIGTGLGALAGIRGGWVDAVVMRTVDVALAIPVFFVLLLLASFYGTSLGMVTLIIGLTSWMGVCRLVRAEFLSLREKEFCEAARALGAGAWRITWAHLLPNAAGPIIVAATLGIARAIIVESALSYLGFGVQPPAISWGSMLRNAQAHLQTAPWLAILPGMLIFVTVLAFNFLGDGLRDALDPHTTD